MAENKAKKSNGKHIIRIMSFIRPYWLQAIAAILLVVVSVIAELIQPRLIQTVIDEGIAQGNLSAITFTVGLMIAIAVFDAFIIIANTFMAVKVAQNVAHDTRSSVFRQIQKFSFGNLDKFSTGELVVRLSSDVNIVQMMVMMLLRMFVRAPILIV